jgi:hypothetical protein
MVYSNDDDEICDYGTYFNFTDYEELISVAYYIDNPDLDKITNLINALVKSNIILKCKEVSFKYNFDYGDYNKWIDTAKMFNKNNECNNHRILIDEDSIVCINLENV